MRVPIKPGSLLVHIGEKLRKPVSVPVPIPILILVPIPVPLVKDEFNEYTPLIGGTLLSSTEKL